MPEIKLKIEITGLPESVVPRLRDLLKDYLTNSNDSDINPPEPGRRSVKLKLKIAGDGSQKTIRVTKKEKKVIRLHEEMAYINSACERSQALLASYFPFDEDDFDYERRVTLTLKVITKPLLMNTNAAAKAYVEIKEDVDDC
ncbi:hypothetical protein Aspvir_004764 [Aspergillus viridinutans]|uniref:Uncharacterized protein n=1 Tax=Aspergillus viridinutans TaxID=75553 RepID=A0A9P3BR17_ASPVI|nr:uncharacterized protein Aspvir_004764 [Aspergillus viridinutans]GIK00735.1 hypothetical protein Aspvir_004764 [Aspergillus viridinutans]